jgi:hypothetical protein
MLDELNLRFAPAQGLATHYGGLDEMVALQKEFKILKKGRSFKTSVAALNLGARNNEVKNRWLDLVGALSKHASNVAKQNGDAAIVNALVKNLAAKVPLPVYFTSHPMQQDANVNITSPSRPVHYLEQDYLTISLPMQSVQAANAARKSKAAVKSTAKPVSKK